MSLTVTEPNILSSLPTWASTVSVTVDIFFACASISSFSFLARSAATRLLCSNDLIFRSLATTAFLRGRRKFLANPSFTSMRSPRWPTPSIVSCRITFMPLTPSVGKEKRILEGLKKSQSWNSSGRVFEACEPSMLRLDSRPRAPVSCTEDHWERRIMAAREFIERWATQLAAEQAQLDASQGNGPLAPIAGRLLQAVGTLYLYEF